MPPEDEPSLARTGLGSRRAPRAQTWATGGVKLDPTGVVAYTKHLKTMGDQVDRIAKGFESWERKAGPSVDRFFTKLKRHLDQLQRHPGFRVIGAMGGGGGALTIGGGIPNFAAGMPTAAAAGRGTFTNTWSMVGGGAAGGPGVAGGGVGPPGAGPPNQYMGGTGAPGFRGSNVRDDPAARVFALYQGGQMALRAGQAASGFFRGIENQGMVMDIVGNRMARMTGQYSRARNRSFTNWANRNLTGFTSAEDLYGGVQTTMTALPRANQGQMQRSLRNVNQLSLLMPELGFQGAAQLQAQLADPAMVNRLGGLLGQGVIGQGGQIRDMSRVLRGLGETALGRSFNVRGGRRAQAMAFEGFQPGSKAFTNLAAQGLSPEIIQAVQEYMATSAGQGHYINLASRRDTRAAGIGDQSFITGRERQEERTRTELLTWRRTQEQMDNFNELMKRVNRTLGDMVEHGGPLANMGFYGGKAADALGRLANIALAGQIFRGGGGVFGGGRGGGPTPTVPAAGGGAAAAGTGALAAGGMVLGAAAVGAAAEAGERWAGGKLRGNRNRFVRAYGGWVSGLGEGRGNVGSGMVRGAWRAGMSILGRDRGDAYLPGPGHTTGLDPSFAEKLRALFAANPRLTLTDGYRSHGEQADLYRRKPGLAAPPGRSLHEKGLAADIGPRTEYGWLAQNVAQFGLYLPMAKKEPWHVQPTDARAKAGATPVVEEGGAVDGAAGSGASFGQLTTLFGGRAGQLSQVQLAAQIAGIAGHSMFMQGRATSAQTAPAGSTATGTQSAGYNMNASQSEIAQTIVSVGRRLGSSPKHLLAAFEAALVESGMRNLDYGDRDSRGVFQQRPSQGWGTPQQIMNPAYAAEQFLKRAPGADRSNQTAGGLAQRIQRSAYPDRYDKKRSQSVSMLQNYGVDASGVGDPVSGGSTSIVAAPSRNVSIGQVNLTVKIDRVSEAEADRLARMFMAKLRDVEHEAIIGSS